MNKCSDFFNFYLREPLLQRIRGRERNRIHERNKRKKIQEKRKMENSNGTGRGKNCDRGGGWVGCCTRKYEREYGRY